MWSWRTQHTPITFQSTPSARRATVVVQIAIVHDRISIHALREESDLAGQVDAVGLLISIHALREEGDFRPGGGRCQTDHFNPRPPRGGRPDLTDLTAYALHISIHALREESDPWNWARRSPRYGISIHALREEGDVSGTSLKIAGA